MANKNEYTINCDCTEICKQCSVNYIDDKVPEYYKGKNGYQARKVVENFNLNYNLGTATTYILRAYHKHDTAKDCIEKAIHHLQFELETIENGEA
tara:strand:- start:2217 stop:2501 length:285 start_codon:yes stop_codon:yes gene_type:complete